MTKKPSRTPIAQESVTTKERDIESERLAVKAAFENIGRELKSSTLEYEAVAKDKHEVLRVRLRALIKLRKTTAQQVSLKAGWSYGVVRDILSGKVKDPKPEKLEKIAEILRGDVAYLVDNHDIPPVEDGEEIERVPVRKSSFSRPAIVRNITRWMKVIGTAEVANFRLNPLNWDSDVEIKAPPFSQMMDGLHFALKVRSGVVPETVLQYALVVTADEDISVRDGCYYAVLHRLPVAEATEVAIRRARIVGDKVELTANQGIDVRRIIRLDDEGVSILGLAYMLMAPLVED